MAEWCSFDATILHMKKKHENEFISKLKREAIRLKKQHSKYFTASWSILWYMSFFLGPQVFR